MRKDLTPLSSVACGATPFLRKGAKNCGGAATTTLRREASVKLKNLRGISPVKLQNPFYVLFPLEIFHHFCINYVDNLV